MNVSKDVLLTYNELREKGIRVEVTGNNLRLTPKSKLTPKLIERVRKHKAEIIKALQPQWQKTNSLFQASLSRVEKCYIPGAIEKALRKNEVCSAFEMLDKVWKDVLKGKEDIASFEKALKQWEIILLSSLKEFV